MLCMWLVTAAVVGGSRTFGTSLKGAHFRCQVEMPVFQRECAPEETPCAMQHYWSGGTFAGYGNTIVRYYVDNVSKPVSMPLGLAHGLANGSWDDNAPWSAGSLFGRSGSGLHSGGPADGSGLFNTFAVPFGSHVNVTISLGCAASTAEYFWLILRGRTRATVVLPGGLTLPKTARLRSHEAHALQMAPYTFIPITNISSGLRGAAVLLVTLSVAAPRNAFEFLEGARAMHNKSPFRPLASRPLHARSWHCLPPPPHAHTTVQPVSHWEAHCTAHSGLHPPSRLHARLDVHAYSRSPKLMSHVCRVLSAWRHA